MVTFRNGATALNTSEILIPAWASLLGSLALNTFNLTSTVKGFVKIKSLSRNFEVTWQVNSLNSYLDEGITLVTIGLAVSNPFYFGSGYGSAVFSNGEAISVEFVRNGDKGTQGTTGSQGIQGLQGTSIQGTQGLQGRQGTTGSGSQGTTGTQGIQGLQGTSIQGTQGISVQGIQGIQGTTGLQGLTGTGTQGATGAQGVTGTYNAVSGSGTPLAFSGAAPSFTSIPGTYKKLIVQIIFTNIGSITGNLQMTVNSGATVSSTIYNTGSTTATVSTAGTSIPLSNGVPTAGDMITIEISNYANTRPTMWISGSTGASAQSARWGIAATSAAITSITFTASAGTFTSATGTAYLYGIN